MERCLWNTQLACYLSNRTMSLRLLFLTVQGPLPRQSCRPFSRCAADRCQRNDSNQHHQFFCNKWSRPPLVHFLLGNSLNRCRELYCLSLRKTLISRLSSSVNGIFTDVTMTSSLHTPVVSLQVKCLITHFRDPLGWYTPKIMKIAVQFFEIYKKNKWRLFSGHGVFSAVI